MSFQLYIYIYIYIIHIYIHINIDETINIYKTNKNKIYKI